MYLGIYLGMYLGRYLGLYPVWWCREALVLVAVPMVASAASTVITTTPLFAATTLILKRFAAVIFVTMIVGLAYVLLFLTPVLAMFGPGTARARDKTMVPSYWAVLKDHLVNSKAVRLFLVVVLMLIAMVRPPGCSPDPPLSSHRLRAATL